MDTFNQLTGNSGNQGNTSSGNNQKESSSGSSGGGIMDSLNSMAGGGAKGEKNEDGLDKAVDFVQEKMGQGDQSNENAVEQAKDEQISDFIRNKYKDTTGSDFPIADK